MPVERIREKIGWMNGLSEPQRKGFSPGTHEALTGHLHVLLTAAEHGVLSQGHIGLAEKFLGSTKGVPTKVRTEYSAFLNSLKPQTSIRP